MITTVSQGNIYLQYAAWWGWTMRYWSCLSSIKLIKFPFIVHLKHRKSRYRFGFKNFQKHLNKQSIYTWVCVCAGASVCIIILGFPWFQKMERERESQLFKKVPSTHEKQMKWVSTLSEACHENLVRQEKHNVP